MRENIIGQIGVRGLIERVVGGLVWGEKASRAKKLKQLHIHIHTHAHTLTQSLGLPPREIVMISQGRDS